MYDFYLRYLKHQMNFNDKYEIEKVSSYVQCYYKNLELLMLKYKKRIFIDTFHGRLVIFNVYSNKIFFK